MLSLLRWLSQSIIGRNFRNFNEYIRIPIVYVSIWMFLSFDFYRSIQSLLTAIEYSRNYQKKIHWGFTPLSTLFQLYHGDSSHIHTVKYEPDHIVIRSNIWFRFHFKFQGRSIISVEPVIVREKFITYNHLRVHTIYMDNGEAKQVTKVGCDPYHGKLLLK